MNSILIAGIGMLLFLLTGCSEDHITPSIEYPHLYEIVDNPANPVQHKRFELYEKYNVPVYFNDTIARYFVGMDLQGDSVFRVEKLDMAWKFTSQESNTTYGYVYLTDRDEQLKALGTVEKYLESLSVPLRPFSILVTKSAVAVTNSTEEPLASNVGYRVVLITGAEDLDEQGTEALVAKLKKEMINSKVANYTDELKEFNSISKDWYNATWTNLPGVPAGFYSTTVSFWLGAKPHPERRKIVGQFGFLGGQDDDSPAFWGGGEKSPENANDDLQMYLDEMLGNSKEQFKELWGASPLVMEKYNILYAIIAEKLEVEL